MTDKEMLITLCNKLKLKQESQLQKTYSPNAFVVCAHEMYIGTGKGYSGFFATFEFDSNDNLIGHGLYE